MKYEEWFTLNVEDYRGINDLRKALKRYNRHKISFAKLYKIATRYDQSLKGLYSLRSLYSVKNVYRAYIERMWFVQHCKKLVASASNM